MLLHILIIQLQFGFKPECVKSVLHLGHVLTENLQDDLDIQWCRSDFIKRANCVLHRFAFCTPVVLSYLLCCFVCHTMVVYCGI